METEVGEGGGGEGESGAGSGLAPGSRAGSTRRSSLAPTPVPGLGPAPTSRGPRRSEGKEGRGMQKLLYSLLDTIQGHKDANVFANPVKKVSLLSQELQLTMMSAADTRPTHRTTIRSSKSPWTSRRSATGSERESSPASTSSRGTSYSCSLMRSCTMT